jgi:hypothetical protein
MKHDLWSHEPKTIEEINAEFRAGETPIHLINYFLANVTDATFDSVMQQLDPKLQTHFTDYARACFDSFDETIASLGKEGHTKLSDQFRIYRDWAHRQPWAAEERAKVRGPKWTEEQTQASLAAEFAEENLRIAKRAQEEDARKPNAAAWDPVIAEMEQTVKGITERAAAIAPKKPSESR